MSCPQSRHCTTGGGCPKAAGTLFLHSCPQERRNRMTHGWARRGMICKGATLDSAFAASSWNEELATKDR
jgi:hypothetical protein